MEASEMRQVSRSSPIPLYYQLQEILKEEIDSGRWKPGELLPSEAQMIGLFGVSRTVVRKALEILEADGQVFRVKGKGTVVSEPKFSYEAVSTAAHWGMTDEIRPTLLDVMASHSVPVGGHVGRLLALQPADEVYELIFLQGIKSSPASLTQMFLRKGSSPSIREDGPPAFVRGGAEVLEQLRDSYGLRPIESHVTIEATQANRFESEHLQIPIDAPVFLLASLHFTQGTQAAIFSRTIIRSDYFQFSVVFRHQGQDMVPPLPGFNLEPARRMPTEVSSTGHPASLEVGDEALEPVIPNGRNHPFA